MLFYAGCSRKVIGTSGRAEQGGPGAGLRLSRGSAFQQERRLPRKSTATCPFQNRAQDNRLVGGCPPGRRPAGRGQDLAFPPGWNGKRAVGGFGHWSKNRLQGGSKEDN